MKQILDQNGNPIKSEGLTGIYNRGPFWAMGGLYSSLMDGTYLNPDTIGIAQYKKMEMDDAVTSALLFVTLSSLARIGEYTHPNEEIQTFIRKEFQTIRGSIYDICEELMYTALLAGFSCGELCFNVDDKVHLSDVQFMDPEYIMFELNPDGPMKNRVKAVKQYGSLLGSIALGSSTIRNPPMEKFLHLVLNTRYMNPYGRSRLQAAYPLWYFKQKMLVAWAITGEKHGTPARNFEVGKETPADVDIGDGEKVNIYTFLERSLQSWSNSTGMALPPGVKSVTEEKGNPGRFFVDAMAYADKCIYRALLLPGLVANTSEFGSRALGSTHFQLFDLAIQNNQRTLINTFLDQPIRRLITWNFGPQETWGDFQVDELDPTTADMMMKIFASAIDKGIMDVNKLDDLRQGRKAIGLSDVDKDAFNQEQEAKAAQAAALQQKLDETRQKLQQSAPTTAPQKSAPPIQEAFSRVNGVESYFVEV